MVQEHVSNQTIGKMRMQFWRDAVKGIREVCRQNFIDVADLTTEYRGNHLGIL